VNFLYANPVALGSVLYQQMVRRYKGIENSRAVFAKARRVLADGRSEKTNEQGAKSTNPEPADDDNEATEASLSVKKEDETDGNESTRCKYWASAACWSQDGRNNQDGGKRRS
jgi:hypothetical protein